MGKKKKEIKRWQKLLEENAREKLDLLDKINTASGGGRANVSPPHYVGFSKVIDDMFDGIFGSKSGDDERLPSPKKQTYKCTFCGTKYDNANLVVSGPGSAIICKECVDLSTEILVDKAADAELVEGQIKECFICSLNHPVEDMTKDEDGTYICDDCFDEILMGDGIIDDCDPDPLCVHGNSSIAYDVIGENGGMIVNFPQNTMAIDPETIDEITITQSVTIKMRK